VVPAAEFAVEPMVAVAADSTGTNDPHRKEILAVRISIINSLPYQWFNNRAVFLDDDNKMFCISRSPPASVLETS
jgi:hypothetical protein